ncbi:DUF883 domain-containing protein [Pseudophaeobacter sp.]|uniref:DUF883 family protein n=1 Tax=Pseudophaeobacter sp. TaxID=1971739 RepID=UPI0026283AFD|nr:DUF883 domain-containing protein [Pseudophaeobacter sp.]
MARALTNGSKNETTVADLTDQIETLRKDLSALTGTMADLGKSKGADLTDAAAQQAEAVREKGAEVVEVASKRAKAVQHQANDFVQTQPATALGIAAGVGFLVGIMSTRR